LFCRRHPRRRLTAALPKTKTKQAAKDAAPAAEPKKLWGGRFTGKTDPLMEKFNESLPFDRRMWAEDIKARRPPRRGAQKAAAAAAAAAVGWRPPRPPLHSPPPPSAALRPPP